MKNDEKYFRTSVLFSSLVLKIVPPFFVFFFDVNPFERSLCDSLVLAFLLLFLFSKGEVLVISHQQNYNEYKVPAHMQGQEGER